MPATMDFQFLYDAQCVADARADLLAGLDAQVTNLVRPAQDFEASNDPLLITSLERSFQFLQAQWSGALPPDNTASIGWPKPEGFTNLAPSCKLPYNASFANGGALRACSHTGTWLQPCDLVLGAVSSALHSQQHFRGTAVCLSASS